MNFGNGDVSTPPQITFGGSPGDSSAFSFGVAAATPEGGEGVAAGSSSSFSAPVFGSENPSTPGDGGFVSFGGGENTQFGSEGSGFGTSLGEGNAGDFSFGGGDNVAPVFGGAAGSAGGAGTPVTNKSENSKTSPPGASPAAATAGGADDEAVDDSQLILPDVKFGEVQLTKGTEQEEVLVELRSKMYVFFEEDKYGDEVRKNMWKQRGLGNVQILKHNVTGAYRVLMRQEGTLKITCNAPLKKGLADGYAAIKPNGEKGMVTSLLIYNADEDISELKSVAFKFRSSDMLKEFTEAWTQALENASTSPNVGAAPTALSAPTTPQKPPPAAPPTAVQPGESKTPAGAVPASTSAPSRIQRSLPTGVGVNGDLRRIIMPAQDGDHRCTQIVYKNACARFRALNDGRNASTMARVPGVAHLLGSAIMEKHGMPVLVTTTNRDVVAVANSAEASDVAKVSVSSVQDNVFGDAIVSDGSKATSGQARTENWAAVIESANLPAAKSSQVVVQSTLPMYPTTLGHADAMCSAVELASGASKDSTRCVPVLNGSELAFLSAKGDRTVEDKSFWESHRLVYAVVPQASSNDTWKGSNGDFEAEAAAAIIARKYSYDIGSGKSRLGQVKVVAERDGRPRPAEEWDQLMGSVLDKTNGYTNAEISALGYEGSVPSSASIFKLQQYTRFFFGEAYRAAAAEKDLNSLGSMMNASDRAMRELNIYCSKAEADVVDAARSAGALGARVIPSVASGSDASNAASVVIALVASSDAEKTRKAISIAGRGLETWLEVPGTAGCSVAIDSFLSHDDVSLDEILAQHHIGAESKV